MVHPSFSLALLRVARVSPRERRRKLPSGTASVKIKRSLMTRLISHLVRIGAFLSHTKVATFGLAVSCADNRRADCAIPYHR